MPSYFDQDKFIASKDGGQTAEPQQSNFFDRPEYMDSGEPKSKLDGQYNLPNIQPGLAEDFSNHLVASFKDMYAGDAKALANVTGSETMQEVSDDLAGSADKTREKLSDDAREGMGKNFVEDVDPGRSRMNMRGEAISEFEAGPAWGDIDSWNSLLGSASGSMAAVVSGGGATKIGAKAGLSTIGRAMGRQAGRDAAIKQALKEGGEDAAKHLAARYAARDGLEDSILGSLSYGLTEGGMVGGSVARDVEQHVRDMPAETLAQSPLFQDVYWSLRDNLGVSHQEAFEQARNTTAASLGNEGMWRAGLPSVLLGTVAGRYIDKALTGKLEGTRKIRAAKQGSVETVTEGAQGAVEHIAAGTAIQEADIEHDPMKGLANSVVTEAIGGGMMGAGMGALSRTPDDIEQEIKQERSENPKTAAEELADIEASIERADNAMASLYEAANADAQPTNIPIAPVEDPASDALAGISAAANADAQPTAIPQADGAPMPAESIPKLTDTVKAPEYEGQGNLERATAEDTIPLPEDYEQRKAQVEKQELSPRFANDGYRNEVRRMADGLVKGGDVSYTRDERDNINGRTASVNADWFQGNDDMQSVAYVKDTVAKALNGEKLGKRQRRVVEAMMDVVDDLNGELSEDYSYGAYDPADDPQFTRDKSGAVRFNPRDGSGARTVAMLEEEATDAGVPRKLLDELAGRQLPVTQHAEALYEEIQRHQRRATAKPEGNQSGASEVPGSEAEAPAARPGADEGKAGADTERSESERLGGVGKSAPENAENPTPSDKQAEIEAGANEAATSPQNDIPEPTDGQKEANNYKKGRIDVHGIKIGVENPAGSVRSGTSPDGKRWENELAHHYGDVTGVTGADGDQLDVFVNREGNPEQAEHVFVIDQIDQNGEFDEHKVMLGFPDEAAAIEGYKANYDAGWEVGPVTKMTVDRFKEWLASGDTTKALSREEPRQRRDTKQRNIYNRRIEDMSDAELRDYAQQLRTELLTSERTGLGSNRAWVNREPKKFVASIDVDSLKWVNDHMGHEKGDELLSLVGDAMREVGIADDAYHVSGDEFYAQGDDSVKLRAKLRKALAWMEKQTISGSGYEFTGAGFSYGIAEDVESAESKLQDQKTSREKAGKRAARGEQPSGAVQTAGQDSQSAGAGGDGSQTASDGQGSSEEVLTSYNEEDLRQRDEDAKARENLAETKRKEEEARAQADKDRDDFALTGSDRPADVAASAGQNSLFDAGGKATVKKMPEPDWWKALTGAERYDRLAGAGIKGTASTPWNRISAENQRALNAQWGEKPKPQTANAGAQAESKPKKPKSYGSKNKLVTKERAEELKKQLLAELGTLNSGINPKILAIGTELAVFHVEAGARKFAEMAQAIADDLGTDVRKLKPYLMGWYNGARGMMEGHDLDVSDMDDDAAVRAGLKELMEADTEKGELSDFFKERMDGVADNRDVKRVMAEYLGINPSEVTGEHMKQAQEAIEVALVQRAREAIQRGQDEKKVYDELVSQYKSQPNLNMRSSTSIEKQAYSTPAPIAMLASQLAGIDFNTKVYEPTAGNGMLLIGADPETTDANELDPNRAASLRKLGFNTTSKDAADYVPKQKAYDAVIMNPPFGPLDRFGHPSVVQVGDGYNLKKIDHLIAAKALEAMKDDGKAVIIIGANREPGQIGGGAERVFFNWLYSNYNVADHFEIDGDLYKRQGAGWPIRVIVVSGREESKRLSPKSGTIERLENWDEIYDRYNETKELLDSEGSRADGRGETDTESSAETDQRGGRTEPDGREADNPSDGRGTGGDTAVSDGKHTATGNTGRSGRNPSSDGRVSDDGGADSRTGAAAQSEPKQASNPEPGTDSTGRGTDAGKPSGSGRKKRVGGKASSFQSEYESRSGGSNESILTPRNMAGPIHRALDDIKKAVGGDIDAYVMEKLGYKTKAELHDAFMGLQVDTVAAAIYNHETRDRGIIIADQTGVGKGRQAAAMIRYAQRIGKQPVFISAKPNLFTDMYDDSLDIGNTDIRPFILNKGEPVVSGDAELFKTTKQGYKTGTASIKETGKLPGDSNALFLTYSQLLTQSDQRDVLSALSDPFFILDEAHNAAGEHTVEKKVKGKKEVLKTGAGFVSDLIKGNPVTYLSATYAKRPDNMPVYHRTDLVDAVDNMSELEKAMDKGGVPLQQVAAAMLSENGQLFRRERSFEGINIPIVVDYDNYDAHSKLSDQVTIGLRAIVDANRAFQALVKENKGMFAPEGGSAQIAGNNAQQTGNVNPFTSVVHNYIEQLLLGLKAKTAAEKAIELVKQGKKPVIAFQNTMGSFLDDFAKDQKIKPGDPIDFTYNDVMLNALKRSRRISFTDEKGNSIPRQVELDEMDPYTRLMYEEAEEVIRGLPLGDLPASPVDYWIYELEKAGVRVAEITGRHATIDYSGDRPRLARRSAKQVKDRRGTVDAFNNGTIDALLLNEAGSTGLSAHASEKFKDNKPRHMIVAQQIKDINIMMQMLGRINRTGQVEYPEYTLLSLAVPAEKRPAARAARKLASLNANTSANDKSDNSFDAPDIFNKYGDIVVNDYMIENPDIARAVNMSPLNQGQGAPDGALRFTGRLALLDVKTQEHVYADILRLYQEKIDYLDSIGQNDLVAQVLDLDAHIIDSKIVHEGKRPDSIFAGHTTLHKANVKYLGKPPTADEVAKAIDDALDGTTAEAIAEELIAEKAKDTAVVDGLREELRKAEQALDRANSDFRTERDDGKRKKIENAIGSLKDKIGRIEGRQADAKRAQDTTTELIRRLKIGSRHVLDLGEEQVVGVVTGVKDNHKAGIGLPWAKSKTTVTFMLASGSRTVRLPLSYLAEPMDTLEKTLPGSGAKGLEAIFTPELANTDRREIRYIATGNLIAGMAKLEGAKVVMFTDGDGNEHQGLLMPKKYGKKGEFDKGTATQTSVVHDPKVLARYLLSGGSYASVGAFDADRKLSVSEGRSGLTISVPRANNNKKYQEVKLDRELRDITGDFFGSGKTMTANIPTGKEVEALTRLMEIIPLRIPGNYREHWEETGGDPAPEALKSFDGKRFIAAAAPKAATEVAQPELGEPAPKGRLSELKPTLTTVQHPTSSKIQLHVVSFGGYMKGDYAAIREVSDRNNGRYIAKRDRERYRADGEQGTPAFVFTDEGDRQKFMDELPAALAAKEDVVYDLGGTGATGTVTPLKARVAVAKLERETGVAATVVKNEDALPQRFRRQIDRQEGRGKVRGLYDQRTGKAYVIADNLKSSEDAARVYLHEVVGHMGLRALLGKKLDITLRQIYRDLSPQLKASLAWKYRRQVEGMPGSEQALTLADEYVALLAESDRQNGALAKVVAVVRRWLRKFGLVKGWKEGDILDLIAQGKKRLRSDSRKLGRTGGDARYALQSSRDQLQFKALHTKQGQPVWRNGEVTIHGDRKVENLATGLQMGHEAHVPNDAEVWNMSVYSKGQVIANLVAQVRNGKIAAVHNIESLAAGAGEKVVASLLANNRSGIRVIEAVPGAQGFWSKMGANGFFDQYKNTVIHWTEYEQNRQKRAAETGEQGSDSGVRRGGVLPGAAADAGTDAISEGEGQPGTGPENESLDAESREWLQDFNLRYSLVDPDTDAALEKLGMGKGKARGLRKLVDGIQKANMRAALQHAKQRVYEGVFDGLVGIKRAEEAAGVGVGAGNYAQSGYVGARLASGIADMMHAILHYGAPKWGDGVVEHKEDTTGLLDIFADLGDDLNDWLGWMGGKRGEELMAQGRENNLTQDDISNLLALANGREVKFEEAQQKYAALNKAMLDLAEGAGLIDPKSRKNWESEWYIPFYRQDEDGDYLLAPRTKRGLSHQTSGIKFLRGGETPTNDLLENILTNWMKMADASMKNMALLKTVDNLKDTDYLTNESLRFRPAIVTKREMIQRVRDNYQFAEEMRALLAAYNGDAEEALLAQGEEGHTGPRDPLVVETVIEELESMDQQGLEKLWALQAPTDPDIVRVKRDGKSEYYRVNDPALLRGLVEVSNDGMNNRFMRGARLAKRLLTTGVTASPDFMFRNFVRDAAHAWAINKDGFTFAKDSFAGLKGAIEEDDAYRELMFANASFQGGYVHGTDPEATAQLMRRALLKKGLTQEQVENRMDSIVGLTEKGWGKVQKGWQKYRAAGDKLENANRLATFKKARAANKSLAQAVYEAKDLMDYSLRGNWIAMQALTDMVPFMNARLQGLSKLARAAELEGELLKPWTWKMDPAMGKAMFKIALFSTMLALLNGDDERYQELPDWEKDAYWHILLGDQHLRIPKPFEIGVIAGTMPERMMQAWVLQNQPNDKVLWSLKHNLWATLAMNPTPQFAQPILELWGNRSMFFDTPIETVGDKRKLPKYRYNSHTSDTMVALGGVTGLSPKQMEHLWNGYLGTLGSYTLWGMDLLTRTVQDKPNKGLIQVRDVPVVKSFVRGDAPARSTQYTTDLYDRLQEVEQIYASLKEFDDPLERREFMQENRAKLATRGALTGASRTLSRLRKQRERVMGQEIPAKAKQLKLDAIQRKINEVAARASKATEGAF